MSDKPILAAVSYLNTKPFLYGLEIGQAADIVDIQLFNPGALAESLKADSSQIGLVPVAAIPSLTAFKQFGSFGIGSLGKVASVCAFSHRPMAECKTLILDYQSRSSVALMQILMREYWQLDLPIIHAKPGYEYQVPDDALAVIIGDRALEARTRFAHIYDLAEAWKAHTGLPFLFAAWVAHHRVPDAVLEHLEASFSKGVNNIDSSIAHYKLHLDYYDIALYLKENIYYPVGDAQLQAERLFWNKLQTT